MTPLLPDLDFRFGSRYVRGVDDGGEPRVAASTVIHDEALRRRRPLSPEAAAKRDARARAFAQAAAAQYRRIYGGRTK